MKLVIVPTPIGNLEDMTMRGISTLKSVDLILAEDTRTSAKLLKHFDISTPMKSYHMHNEHKILKSIIEKLKSGLQIALISDAGTPAISDPAPTAVWCGLWRLLPRRWYGPELRVPEAHRSSCRV